jgi:hypothetical protein
MLDLSLSLFAQRSLAAGASSPSVPIPPINGDGIPDEPGPIEDDPDWEIPPDPTPDPDPPPVPPDPPLVSSGPPGHAIAQSRLEANGVAYRNPRAGPKDKKVKATLVEVSQTQGLIAPLVKDQDNYVGTTFDVAAGKLKAKKKVDGVESAVGEVVATVLTGDQIGGIVKGDKYYITLNGQAVAGPFTIPAGLLEKPPGLVAQGPATAAWINNFAVDEIGKGYGKGYGFGYGSAV